MVRIESLSASTDAAVLDSARALFLAYGDFIRTSGGGAHFDFDRLRREAAELPATYVAANGAVLVGVVDGAAAGCVALRAHPSADEPDSCEIKRLFVRPEYRGTGLGRRLIDAGLDHARGQGYRFACLDTMHAVMPAAHRMYVELGFVEYTREGAFAYLRKPLT